jgi:ganglioside-induced differentiation-associated protein 1
MPEIATKRDDIRALSGVHLFHFGLSNCSQRVRFALGEKGVAWTSHVIDLAKQAHLTPEFQALNPKGTVPVLVHDGRTIIDSNDIISYVDDVFVGPALMPAAVDDRAFTAATLDTSSQIQGALKLLSHEFLFKAGRRMTAEQLAVFKSKNPTPELQQFMTDFSSAEGFGDVRIKAAASEFVAAFAKLEARLSSNPWLSGHEFGLADTSWAGNVHRMALMRFPLDRTPKLSRWYRRIKARPAFADAILEYEPAALRAAFKTYTLLRTAQRTSIGSFL